MCCWCLTSCELPMRIQMKIHAVILWLVLAIPSLVLTFILYFSSTDLESNESFDGSIESSPTHNYTCYENYTVYIEIWYTAKFWIEGILQFGVGLLGIFGNILTIFVLSKNKKTNFNNLLIYLSLTDLVLIIIFMAMSTSTIAANFHSQAQPPWFKILFPYFLWPFGHIAITASVLMVVAVSAERYLAICRPLQYKPSPSFYVFLVMFISFSVNAGKFLEYRWYDYFDKVTNTTTLYADITTLMKNEHYVIFSKWQEIVLTGILPLLALIILNYGIYAKIRKSTKFRKKTSSNCGYMGNSTNVPRVTTAPFRRNVNQPFIRPNSTFCGKSGHGSSERSTKLLVGIVVVFLVCQCIRLAIQIDAVIHPHIMNGDHFQYCYAKDRLFSPFIVYVLTCFNSFCLVLNSSINFIVYCVVGRSFRYTLFEMCSRKPRNNNFFMETTQISKHRHLNIIEHDSTAIRSGETSLDAKASR
nr:FMRFamide receptor-like [Lepeophtheirus salmonis]